MKTTAQQSTLFDVPAQLPHGLLYRPRFISPEEEDALLEEITALPFKEARFQQYTARRRVVRYGEGYDDDDEGGPRLEFPPFLVPLRRKLAALAHVPQTQFAHALITQYQPGTPIGWHRDAPHFAVVAGVSLAGACVMRFRPRGVKPDKKHIVSLELEPRSAYVMQGPIRWDWQHSIPPTKGLRYSITMRTLVRPLRVE